jgi:hypothetical protein
LGITQNVVRHCAIDWRAWRHNGTRESVMPRILPHADYKKRSVARGSPLRTKGCRCISRASIAQSGGFAKSSHSRGNVGSLELGGGCGCGTRAELLRAVEVSVGSLKEFEAHLFSRAEPECCVQVATSSFRANSLSFDVCSCRSGIPFSAPLPRNNRPAFEESQRAHKRDPRTFLVRTHQRLPF